MSNLSNSENNKPKVRLSDNPNKRIKSAVNPTKVADKKFDGKKNLDKNFLINVGKKTKSLFYISFIAFLLFLCVFIWLMTKSRNQYRAPSQDKNIVSNDGFTLIGSEAESMYSLNSNTLIKLSTGQISILDKLGQEKNTISIECDNPTLLKNNSYFLVFDLNGKSYYLFNTQGLIYQGETNEPIGFATLSSEGHVAMILNQSNTRGVLRVIDPDGIHLFDYEVRERKTSGYILSCSFSRENQYIDVAMLNTDGVEPFPMVYRFDLLASTLSNVYMCDTNDTMSLIPYSSTNDLVICGNRNIFKLVGKELTEWVSFADIKEIIANDKGLCVLASDSVKGDAKLYFLEFGQDIGNVNLNELKSVSVGASPNLKAVSSKYAIVTDNTVCYKIDLDNFNVEDKEFSTQIVSANIDSQNLITVICKDRVYYY